MLEMHQLRSVRASYCSASHGPFTLTCAGERRDTHRRGTGPLRTHALDLAGLPPGRVLHVRAGVAWPRNTVPARGPLPGLRRRGTSLRRLRPGHAVHGATRRPSCTLAGEAHDALGRRGRDGRGDGGSGRRERRPGQPLGLPPYRFLREPAAHELPGRALGPARKVEGGGHLRGERRGRRRGDMRPAARGSLRAHRVPRLARRAALHRGAPDRDLRLPGTRAGPEREARAGRPPRKRRGSGPTRTAGGLLGLVGGHRLLRLGGVERGPLGLIADRIGIGSAYAIVAALLLAAAALAITVDRAAQRREKGGE